jgi:starvation-inducible DNA-binding protein
MKPLQAALKIVFANAYIMYFKSHTYHWNVEGPSFSMLHDFFGMLYEEIYDSIDTTAEHIRATQEYAPLSLADVLKAGTIKEDTSIPSTIEMIKNLLKANDEMINSWNVTFKLAESNNDQGLINYIAERLDIHAKHGWMLRSYMK